MSNEEPNPALRQTNVSGCIKSEHQIIDEYYPTINHAELGELYCRDKVILIMREHAEQFKEHYWSPESIDRLKAEYFEKGTNVGGSPI